MIRASQATFVRNAELHIDETMQAAVADKSETSAAIFIENEILAQHAHFAHRIFQQLSKRRDGNPIAAHKVAARRSGADSSQPLVCFNG